ncbi:MAG: hypothetical protein D6791_00885, partial [Chloroflexi bacterium]
MVAPVGAILFLLTLFSGTIQAGPLSPHWQATPLPAGQSGEDVKIAPEVEEAIQALPAGQMVSVIVTLKDQANLQAVTARDRGALLSEVVTTLQAKASAGQEGLRALLKSRRAQGQVG